jgi:polyisoprenoid-binding protein YceI
MKSWIAAFAVIALAACSQPAPAPQAPAEQAVPIEAPSGQYRLDPNHSTVVVDALRFGLANYVLRFNAVSGSLNFNAEDPAQSSVEATVAVTSLDTPYTGERDFDAELQNSQWLDSATYPNAVFRSTSVERTGPNTARVTGDLTLRGVTHPLTLDVRYNASYRQHPAGTPESLIGFSARGVIPRSQFGVTSMAETPGAHDGVADQVQLRIEAVFTRPVEGAPATRSPAEPVD